MPVNELLCHSNSNVTFLVHRLCATGVVLFCIFILATHTFASSSQYHIKSKHMLFNKNQLS